MSERFKEPVLKTGDGETHRGFESHSLRQNRLRFISYAVFFLTTDAEAGEMSIWQFGSMKTKRWDSRAGMDLSAPEAIAPAAWSGQRRISVSVRNFGSRSQILTTKGTAIVCFITRIKKFQKNRKKMLTNFADRAIISKR